MHDRISQLPKLYKNMTKHILTSLTISAASVALFLGTTLVQAEDTCVTQYGGSQYGTACNPNDLVINKEVQKIGSNDSNGNPIFVENVSTTDTHATAGTTILFRLTIKNNSNQTFTQVEVKDIFPPYLSYVSGGPSGTIYDAENRTMISKLENLTAGETRTMTLTTKVVEDGSFPAGKANFCVVNTGKVASGDRNDEDTAQLCIKTPDVKGASTSSLPKAGVNDLMLMIPFALLGLAGVGLAAKKI